jgi:hypothetical protein
MAKPSRYVPRDSSRRRAWVYLAIGALALVVFALVVFALNSNRAGATAEAPHPLPTITAAVSSEPTATPSPTAPKTLAATPVVSVPPTRILAAVDGTTAWRALTGSCPATPVSPELTTDSGATWATKDATGPTKVTAVQSLSATSGKIVSLVGLAAADCAPQFVKTFVGGDNFKSYPDKLDGSWYVNPADRATVHSPAGDAPAPCPSVIALAPRNENSAAVLCANQTVFTTTDGAQTWSPAKAIPGAVNLNATQMGYVIAAVGLPECAGVQLISLSNEASTVTPTGCLLVDAPVQTMSGNVAVSEASGTVWLWVGDQLKRSSDRGATWQ